jgi:hypothetical protein
MKKGLGTRGTVIAVIAVVLVLGAFVVVALIRGHNLTSTTTKVTAKQVKQTVASNVLADGQYTDTFLKAHGFGSFVPAFIQGYDHKQWKYTRTFPQGSEVAFDVPPGSLVLAQWTDANGAVHTHSYDNRDGKKDLPVSIDNLTATTQFALISATVAPGALDNATWMTKSDDPQPMDSEVITYWEAVHFGFQNPQPLFGSSWAEQVSSGWSGTVPPNSIAIVVQNGHIVGGSVTPFSTVSAPADSIVVFVSHQDIGSMTTLVSALQPTTSVSSALMHVVY